MVENIKVEHNQYLWNLGKLLGEIIKEAEGDETFELIENVRRLSKASQEGDVDARTELISKLQGLNNSQFLPLVKAFNQFLNLTNSTEQFIQSDSNTINPIHFGDLFKDLKEKGITDQILIDTVSNISIDLVLTAHPTEINRRSLINNLNDVESCLSWSTLNIPDYKKKEVESRLKQLIAQYWYTDEIRQNRPTPNDEAKWGYEVIENSLWNAVPLFLKEFGDQVYDTFGYEIPLDARPIHFSSWMGGDRDGNPNVRATNTSAVLIDARLRAAKLYLADIEVLVRELSMSLCTAKFREYIQDDIVQEPYRQLMKKLRADLKATIHYLEMVANGEDVTSSKNLILTENQLWEPLVNSYHSLVECNMKIIANDKLLNTIRRLRCFGMTLTQLDIRQESTVHTEVLSEILKYLEIGDYESWDEEQKVNFLLAELVSKRPLIPQDWAPSEQTKELLDTLAVIAKIPQGIIPTYIISMTRSASDILAVYLLLKETNCPYYLPVTPLFETLNDLNNAKAVMQSLFQIKWYRNLIADKQMVMIGYSDSAKDAGALAAGWAQYEAQEQLIQLCKDNNVLLTLFHGRGGTIGRGGAPAKIALFSQPPGSLKGGLRVTEQGEMIRFKFANPTVAISTLALYTEAIIEANILPPPAPKEEWRSVMKRLSKESTTIFQNMVKRNADFVTYFYEATPETELAKLPLGSRPSKRRPNGGIETLRAIPWIFGWTQNRLMLPSWYGAGPAFRKEIAENSDQMLLEMYQMWPFFETRISMLEMVFSKSDARISKYYDTRLVEDRLQYLGEELRDNLAEDIKTILNISKRKYLNENIPHLSENIALRNIYTDPLNVLQVELLDRCRKEQEYPKDLEQALMVTISGIAAGMRNSG